MTETDYDEAYTAEECRERAEAAEKAGRPWLAASWRVGAIRAEQREQGNAE